MTIKRVMILVLILGLGLAAWYITRPPDALRYEAEVISPELALPDLGFRQVAADYAFDLPADAQPHPSYQREAWQLDLGDCYEGAAASLRFERLGLLPPALASGRQSGWALQQVMLATLRLPDREERRYSRANLGLAGAEAGRVWVENWALSWDEAAENYRLELGDSLSATFRARDPSSSTREGYHQITWALEGETAGSPCSATLTQAFGERLP